MVWKVVNWGEAWIVGRKAPPRQLQDTERCIPGQAGSGVAGWHPHGTLCVAWARSHLARLSAPLTYDQEATTLCGFLSLLNMKGTCNIQPADPKIGDSPSQK